jgi:type VI secretion system ImpM family protein
MFSFLGKEQAPVQLYGKLPLAKDYLRVGAGQGAGQTFRDWLDRAFSQAPNAKDALTLAWPAAFVLGDSWGAPLVGAAWPSSDAGGLRPFPFVAFVERKKKAVQEDLDAGAPVSAAVWQRLHEVYASREEHSDAQSFLGAMRTQQVDFAALEAPPAESVNFDTWLEALWPGKGKEGLLETLCGLEALRKQAHRGPLRLPLALDLPTRPQSLAWVKLLIEMNLVPRDLLPTLFFPLPDRLAPPPAEAAPAPEAASDPFGSSFSSSFSSSFDAPSSDPFSSDAPNPFDSAPAEASPSPSEGGGETLFGDSSGAASDALPSESVPPRTPAFVVLFRAAPSPADAVWLRAPQAGRARPAGDLCPAEARSAAGAQPAPENLPPLWESLRGAFIALRGRVR